MTLLYRLLLLIGLLSGMPALAQTTYPVQVNTHLLPPYSPYLSDYASGTREKLTLTLINRDQLKPSLNVRLRLSITAPGGIKIQTTQAPYTEPLLVEAGIPLRLSAEELAPYFQPQNLTTQGALREGKLPEGMVEFCFQVVEAYTNQPLSAFACARAFITSQKPPLLSLPHNNESTAFREPLNLLFQWTPRHQGVTYVEYEFILRELLDNGMPPQAAFPYAPEIHRETTRSTSLLYGAMQAPLLVGKRYAWCVRAQAREGTEEVNLFQNQGYSEVRTFSLQDNCAPPALVAATAERKRIKLGWQALPQSMGYTISYRLQNNPEWKELSTQEPQATLSGLQNGGTYQYRVGNSCLLGQPVYGPIFTLTLPAEDSARLAQCGILPALNLHNQQPLPALRTGEVVMAGDFPVTLTRVSGSNGTFSGEGWTLIPWLNDAKIAVTFSSIGVNTDRQMIRGYIDAKYDANGGQIANLDDVFEGGFDVGKVKTGLTQIDYTFDFSIPGVQAFSLNEEGQLVITDSNGEPHTVGAIGKEGQGNEGNKVVVFPLTVQDKDGNIYQVEKVPDPANPGKEIAKATAIGKAGMALAADSFDASQLNGDKAIVSFEKGAGVYGFDTWQPYYEKVVLIQNKYQRLYQDANGQYYAPWKLLPVGKSEGVVARILIKDKTIDPKKVLFKTPKGTEFKAPYDPSTQTYQLSVVAGPAGDAQEVYALHPRGGGKYYNLGKLSIASYTPQNHKVVLVPVEGAPVEEQAIRQALEQVYGPAAISWQVEKAPNFAYAGNANLMSSSTGLATYNADMKALNNAYRAALGDKFDPKANYLFFLKATGATTVNDRDATGFMPRGAQFGYLFTSEIAKSKQATTVAHELGHGRWKLFHTFDKHYGGFQRQQTNNVMDYADGQHLAKWQWDLIHDPAMLVSIFESDDKSADLRTNDVPRDLLNGTTYNFITPTGKKITLPQHCRVTFHFGLTTSDQISHPIGYLHRFQIENDQKQVVAEYAARINNGIFKGYFDSNDQPYPQTLTSQDQNDNVIVLVPEKEGVHFIKYQASLAAFAPNETVLDYASFPIQPYLQPAVAIKKSELIPYEKISGRLQHQNEDWTLHKDFFSKALQLHNGKAEHALIVKIVELRTAYRALFEQFTDPACYESWTKSLQKPGTTTSPHVPTPMVDCSGAWEAILRQDPQRLTLRESNPVEFYRLFLSEFIKYIQNQSLIKQNFLATLSLSTPQREATDFLQLCSNEEVTSIPWQKRKILLRVLARQALYDHTEEVALRLVKHLPASDRQPLLTTLAQEKDADNKGILLKRYLGQTTDDLNGKEFYEFVHILHSYANEQYHYDKSPFALGKNRKANRYFSFDPSFWTNQPIVIGMSDQGKVNLAFRHQFTTLTYGEVAVDPYESVTLHFEDDKSTGEFVLDKGSVYTTSGLMAYALCYSVAKDNLKIAGFVVLNTALMLTGIGELNAALAAGRTGGAILAGTDIALGVAAIVVDTKYRDVLQQSENGRAVLDFWDKANLIYAGGRITQVMVTSAIEAKAAAKLLEANADEAQRAVLLETQAQADNVINAGVGNEIRFVEQVAETAGMLAKHRDLRFIYGGLKPSLGNSATKFENALKTCPDEVMAKFNQHPDLLYKLGNIEDATEAVIKSRLDEIAKSGRDFGVLRTAAGNVPGKSNAVLFTKINNHTDLSSLKPKFTALDDAKKSRFLDDFKEVDDDVLRSLNSEVDLLDVWNQNLSNLNKTNVAWLRWIKNGRQVVPELSREVSKHTNKGEIKIGFHDETPDFVSTPDKIWVEMEDKFMNDDVFAAAVLKHSNLKGQSFGGLHSIDEIERLAQQTVHAQPLLTYSSKSIVGVAGGKTAYTVNTPKVFMPSIDNLKSINKNKVLANRVWTTQGREIGKAEKISSTFLEGMTSSQVDEMISEAFVVKVPRGSFEWDGKIMYNNKKVTIAGYIRNNNITSAFITKIE